MTFTWITLIYLLLYTFRQCFELRLDFINAAWLRTHRGRVPDHLKANMTVDQLDKALDYNLDNHKYLVVYRAISIPVHWFFLITGFQWLDTWLRGYQLNPYLTGLCFFGAFSVISSIIDLPFNLYHDFVLEERYGFNRKTIKIFLTDMLKGTVLGAILGGIIIFLILWLMNMAGAFWWLFAVVMVLLFQVLMLWLVPVVILPLFNKLTPLEGDFRTDIQDLAARAEFPATEILTMDGSKRSGHANAFFTGIGKNKRIVFYDTLLDQIGQKELLGVLAHEMGHYKLGHIKKMIAIMTMGIVAFFGLLALLKSHDIFYISMGFQIPSDYAALVIFSVIFQEITFPFRYLMNHLSRKHEYEADAFAVKLTESNEGLINALEKLHEVNLSAPVTHPAYAAYHYSHPDMPERLAALNSLGQSILDRSPSLDETEVS